MKRQLSMTKSVDESKNETVNNSDDDLRAFDDMEVEPELL
jgi:hypothetical protein